MRFDRLKNMIGDDKLTDLNNKKIIVFGLGGVGSFAAEALVRSAVGNLTVVDYDVVDISNINRQLVAYESTINQKKVDVFTKRALDINPNIKIIPLDKKVSEENLPEILLEDYDFVLDCIDDVKAKVAIAKYCLDNNLNFIASMGFANKFHPELIKVSKLNQTSMCPLAKAFRYQLKTQGYSLNFPVVYSEEKPASVINKDILGSNAYCPSIAGLQMAAYTINYLIGEIK